MASAGKSVRNASGGAGGFTLVEVMLALFLIGIGVLAAAPMFILAMQGNAVGADFGWVGAVGVERMELLRTEPYSSLPAGGSLTVNAAGYFDTSTPGVTVRWTIADNTTPARTKTITVLVVADRQVVGDRKNVTIDDDPGAVMRTPRQGGFSLIEMLVSITVLLLAMAGLSSLLIQNARVNKSQQMTVAVQANARNCLSMIVQRLRSAGWDPLNQNTFSPVILDQDLADSIDELEVFADLDMDGLTDSDDEQVLIRHVNNQVVWRRTNDTSDPFIVLATNISNDENGDGVPEPMFVPDATPDPARIRVRITAQSPAPDPTSGEFIRYTVSSDVALRKAL